MASTAPASSISSTGAAAAGAAAAGGGGDAAAFSSASVTSNQASRQSPSSFSSEPSDASDDERAGGSNPARRQLPSLPSAALLQLRSGSHASGGVDERHRRRSRSRSRSRSREPRWSGSRGDSSTAAKGLESEGTDRGEDRSSFSGSMDDAEMRIMFHGREVFADDLVGLRVAKTFAGHGRFLGQVVRFDEPTALYTVVYADGDAEELSIESTIQILIQDEIERADPSLPPASATYSKTSYSPRVDSPDRSSAQGPPPTDAVAGASGAPISRPALRISEREAQLVIGLFETHALPVLLREGWKLQTSASGAEQRYYAPPGSYPGTGRVFASVLAVVELIASDERMLAACFPSNVHASILSLFTDPFRAHGSSSGSARKRGTTLQADSEAYDVKRQRSERDDMSGPPGSHFHAMSIHHGARAPPSSSQRRSDPREQRGYYSDDTAMDREREAYPSDRIPPGRFGNSSSALPRDAHHRDVDDGGVRASPAPSGGVDADEYRRQNARDASGAMAGDRDASFSLRSAERNPNQRSRAPSPADQQQLLLHPMRAAPKQSTWRSSRRPTPERVAAFEHSAEQVPASDGHDRQHLQHQQPVQQAQVVHSQQRLPPKGADSSGSRRASPEAVEQRGAAGAGHGDYKSGNR
ncbi:hypothetical protein PybrP1_002382 [[Pythium] brassicae (nom. inval.)]|nr:hypothetical protein PybrP1_002382 [[Pythium] brassicae (nom. inval.)]